MSGHAFDKAEVMAEEMAKQARQACEKAEEMARHACDRAEEMAKHARDKAEEVARQARERAEEIARHACEKCEEMARQACDRAEEVARHACEKCEEMARHAWTLVHHHHLPKWLRDNEFLTKGHRPQLYSFCACFRSIFRVHTETGNIWTHLLGEYTIQSINQSIEEFVMRAQWSTDRVEYEARAVARWLSWLYVVGS